MMPEVLFDMTRGWMSTAVSATGAALLASAVLWRATPFKCWRLHLWIGWVMNRLELCRRMYIRSRRPFRIILMRHAESEGNVDKGIYSLTPDHALKITDKGKRQAAVAGRELKKLIGDESVNFIVSPYTRTRMTYEIVRKELGCTKFAMKEDPRLRELDFGNFQDLVTMEKTMETRKAFGRFWFRFLNGESGADVYDRATAFWESVFRSMDHTTHCRYKNYVIITHGLMMRLILMRYFQWKVAFFERVWNPDNCETWVMERDELGSYRVVTEILDRPTAVTAAEEKLTPALAITTSQNASAAASVAIETRGGAAGTGAELPAAGIADATATAATTAAATTTTTAGGDGPPSPPRLFRKLTVDMPEGKSSENAAAGGGTGTATAAAAAGAEGDAHGGGTQSQQAFWGQGDASVGVEVPAYSPTGRGHLDAGSSALNLRDGGFAPGEEGYGRDEEL